MKVQVESVGSHEGSLVEKGSDVEDREKDGLGAEGGV